MTEEADKTKEAKATDGNAAASSSKMSGLIKYVMFGVAGLVIVLGIAFGTLMMLGSDHASEESEGTSEVVADNQSARSEDESDGYYDESDDLFNEDSLLAFLEDDESVMEEILANLAALDYSPDEADLTEESSGMSVEDSLEAVNWLETEKSRLATREADLDAREKSLNIIEAKVSQQIVRIEQAESSRISKLAKLYDGMEARAVAKLIANLDDGTVVSLLPRMKLKKASQVLSLVPPVRGASLSKQMITIAEN